MSSISKRLILSSIIVLFAHVASAQTADDVIAKVIAATGGRAALAKLKSRSMTGSITLSIPGGEVTGSVEIFNAAPNKSRSVIKVDLSSFGAGQEVIDQRFDGSSGYVIDLLQGNHDVTGGQLDNMRNSEFPSPLLNYKQLGMTAKLDGREKVGDRDAIVLILEPASGSAVRQSIDAETYLVLKVAAKIDVPQLGRTIEQTTELSDYRTVDGVKLPFVLRASSEVQNYTITIAKVEHNVPIDESLFAKPKP